MRKEEGPGELHGLLRNPRKKPEQPGSGAPRDVIHIQKEIVVDAVISYLEIQNNRDTYC